MTLTLVLVAFALTWAPGANAQQTGTDNCQVPAQGSCTQTYFLDSGYKYSFSIGGGTPNSTVTFYIEEPDGSQYDLQTLDLGQTVSVSIDTAGSGGTAGCSPPPDGTGCHPGSYVLTFNNSSGQNATAPVSWTHYDENQAAVSSIPEFSPQLLVVSVLAVLVVVSYALVRRSAPGS